MLSPLAKTRFPIALHIGVFPANRRDLLRRAGKLRQKISAEDGRERLGKSLSEAASPLVSALTADPRLSLEAVCVGLTGVTIPGKREAATEILSSLFPGVEIIIESDTVTAWAGALSGEDGVIVIGGTGSVAYGRSKAREVRKGGFGYLFGDEGSGFRIACDAVAATLREYDRTGPITSLSIAVRSFFGVPNVRMIPGKVYSESGCRARGV